MTKLEQKIEWNLLLRDAAKDEHHIISYIYLLYLFITHAGGSRTVQGRVISGVSDFVLVCPRSKRRLELPTYTVYASPSSCIDSEEKRSKVKVERLSNAWVYAVELHL